MGAEGAPPSDGPRARGLRSAESESTGLPKPRPRAPLTKPDVTGNTFSLFNKSIPLFDGSGISDELATHLELTPAQRKVVDQAVRSYNSQVGEQIMATAVREVSERNSVSKWTIPPFFEGAKREFGYLEQSVRRELDEVKADALIAGLWGHLLDKAFFEQVLTIDNERGADAVFKYERRDPKTGRHNAGWFDAVERAEGRLDIDVNRLP